MRHWLLRRAAQQAVRQGACVSVSEPLFATTLSTRPSRRPRQLWVRGLARSSLDAPETPFDKAVAFVVTVGYDAKVARGVVQALQDSGLSGEGLLAASRALAGRWEVGEDEGLEALVASVQQEIQAQQNTEIVTIHVVPGSAWDSSEGDLDVSDDLDAVPAWEDSDPSLQKRAFIVKAYAGTSLTDVAKFGTLEGASTLGEYLECACSGIMACSTCHVVVDRAWSDRVGIADENEQDMIDLAYGPRHTSRLGCQVVLTPAINGLVLWLPKGHNNIMDHIPFE
jgi:ferredoxin